MQWLWYDYGFVFAKNSRTRSDVFAQNIAILKKSFVSLQAFSQNYDLISHTIHLVCINFLNKWQNPEFKANFGRQTFEKLFLSEFSSETC